MSGFTAADGASRAEDRPGFAFVHGGFHGGWCWEEVVKRLAAPCIAVDLPGRSGTAQELGSITYADWINSAVAQVSRLPTRKIVLVCHSLGGITAPQVAVRLPDRVRHVVFIASVLPPEGVSFFDAGLSGPPASGPVWSIPPVEVVEALLCNDMRAGSAARLRRRLNPEPTGPLRVPLSRNGLARDRTTFVRGSRDATRLLHDLDDPASALRREFPGATAFTLDAGHSMMMSQPQAVADILTRIAAEVSD